MKKSFFVLVWTILIIVLGLYIHSKTDNLSSIYVDKFTQVETHIKNENWDRASDELIKLNAELNKEKCTWYKIINHGYFNEVFISINILEQSIYLRDKMISLQEIEKIKTTFQNLEEDECCDFNRIF